MTRTMRRAGASRGTSARLCSVLLLCGGAALLPGCGTNVTPRNHPPVIRVQADTTVAPGDTLHLQAVATDEDWDQLTYKAIIRVTPQELRAGFKTRALMNFNTGRFWFAPTSRDGPDRTIWFVADDGRGGTDSTMFIVRVGP